MVFGSTLNALLARCIAKELGIPGEEISILDLESAPPSLVATVLKKGIKIIDRSGEEEKLLSRVGLETLELNELSEVSFEEWVKRNPLDPRIIGRIVAQIEEDVEDLKNYLSMSLEVVLGNRTMRKAFERTPQTDIL